MEHKKLLTDVEFLAELMQAHFEVWNKYHLDQGDIITLLAHLNYYILYRKGVH